MRITLVQELSVADRDRVRKALADAFAASTRRAYLSHWEAFEGWARERGHSPAPASPEAVAAHLADLARTASASTLRIRRVAIGAAHRAAQLQDPTAAELVKRTLSGLVRQVGSHQRQASPLTEQGLDAIRTTARQRRVGGGAVRRRLESAVAARRRGLVDIALCSVMRDALLRREEAAALTWADVPRQEDGSGRLAVRRSKTDQESAGALLYLGPLAMRDLDAIRPPEGAPGDRVFALSAGQISRRIAAAARAAGLGEGFSGHSPRIGMAQDLSAAGATLSELMQAGRWTSSSMPAVYIRSQLAGRGAVAKYHAGALRQGKSKR